MFNVSVQDIEDTSITTVKFFEGQIHYNSKILSSVVIISIKLKTNIAAVIGMNNDIRGENKLFVKTFM